MVVLDEAECEVTRTLQTALSKSGKSDHERSSVLIFDATVCVFRVIFLLGWQYSKGFVVCEQSDRGQTVLVRH